MSDWIVGPNRYAALLAKAKELYEAEPRRRTIVVASQDAESSTVVRGDGAVIPWDEVGGFWQGEYLLLAARE